MGANTPKRLCILIVGLQLMMTKFAAAEVTLYTDTKPFRDVLLNAELPSGSLVSDTMRFVLAKLSKFPRIYHHNLSRAEQLLTDNTASCLTIKIRTPEREEQYLFSGAIDLYLSHRLYVRKALVDKVIPELNDKKQVISLSALLNQFNDKSILLIKNHSYGAYLDHEISNINPSQPYYLYSTDPYDSYLEMLDKKRTDFALLYPFVKDQLASIDYELFAFQDNPPLVSGHLMCNKHPESQAFLKEVDYYLTELYRTHKFEEFARKYFPKKEMPLIQRFIESELKALESAH